ncbi:hypothetical protein SAY86_006480 [Trapa natans]|uniref:ABC transporter domain-containing protein n=1 Tax=Trapa natans TaxID=22666 RepID=A0AAN7QUA7_TRANT|nr:hypothetical protein SAY86_006480 [Trapa natans]
METEMADIEAQTRVATNGDTVRNADSAAIFRKANRPVTLKFEDVVYTIKLKKGTLIRMPKNGEGEAEKVILKKVSGMVRPGEMLAMLGPSGSGKTTLLTALGGRLSGKVQGSITYNGQPFTHAMKRNTGFVTQDDVLYPHLTVAETLNFTALLRLPNTFSKEEKRAHAEAVIAQLGLAKCKDSIIGDSLLRGVSGGERKRVSIGQEMLINPSILFLDEPTSGLDSTTAQRIVSTLWELAKGGRTVAMTIHQPSSRIFYMFHKVLLLSEGSPLYFGDGASAMDYFSSVGYSPSVAMNPSDFLLDLANGVSEDYSGEGRLQKVKDHLAVAYMCHIEENLKAEMKRTDEDTKLSKCNQVIRSHAGKEDKQFARWPTTWGQQFGVLLKRGIKERKHESFSGLRIAQVLAVALICGLLWWQSNADNLQDKIGLLFFYSGFWGFYPLFQALFTFPQERLMLAKERSSGMYRLSSYFMALTLGDLPMCLVLPTVFVTITYWMAGFNHAASSFIFTLLSVLYSVLVSQGLGLALGALLMDLKSATILGSVLMLTFQLAGGYYVHYVPPFIGWIKYISSSYYTYKLLLRSQFSPDDTYACGGGDTAVVCLVREYPGIEKVGLGGQAVAVVALGIMLVGLRLIAYMALTRVGVTRR